MNVPSACALNTRYNEIPPNDVQCRETLNDVEGYILNIAALVTVERAEKC
jgi:hypothetical protein